MLVQASSSRSTLASHHDAQLVPHSPQLRRLLSRLDKSQLVRLTLQWLSSTKTYHVPPKLSRRQPSTNKIQDVSEAMFRYHAILDLNEERRTRSLESLQLIWGALMVDSKVPKTRAVERIITVDWVDGLSYGMVAEVDLLFGRDKRTSRNWTAVQLVHDDDQRDSQGRGFDRLSPLQLQERFSTELAHYFEHHIFLQIADPSNDRRDATPPASVAPAWTSEFTYLRVVLAPSPADICAPGLHILHIPRSPFLLLSGTLGRGNENREIALSALAQAAGAATINYPRPPPGSLQAKRLELDELGEDKAGNRRTLGELRGKDPLALREVLVSEAGTSSGNGGAPFPVGVAGGGKTREMRSAEGAEDGPLIAPLKRRREQDVYSIGVRLPTPPPTPDADEESGSSTTTKTTSESRIIRAHSSLLRASSKGNASPAATPPPLEEKVKVRHGLTVKTESKREARDLFGQRKGKDEDLPKFERIDFDLYLEFPANAAYNIPLIPASSAQAEAETTSTVKLRLEGTHVLAGLRKLVEAGMDRRKAYRAKTQGGDASTAKTESGIRLAGLPSWMTEVRGTKVSVERPSKEGDDSQ